MTTSSAARPTALITGAGGSLGTAMARLLAQRRLNLLLTARSEDKLRALAVKLTAQYGIQAQVVALDLTDPGAAAELARESEYRQWPINVLINSAGLATSGGFSPSDLSTQLNLLQVNITALTELTHRFLPGMLKRGRGRTLNLVSTAAFTPGPLMATQSASSAYVLGFSEALNKEHTWLGSFRDGAVTRPGRNRLSSTGQIAGVTAAQRPSPSANGQSARGCPAGH